MLIWVLLFVSFVVAPALVYIGVRREIRKIDRILQRAAWPWAEAYYRLRDERDADGDLPKRDRP